MPSDESNDGASDTTPGRFDFRNWPGSSSTNSLWMSREGFPPVANPMHSLSQTFKEAQKSCDSLVLSAREHPKVKSFVSEWDKMEATLKKQAQEGLDSIKRLRASSPGSGEPIQLPFPPSLPIQADGIRRNQSEGSLRPGPFVLEPPAIPEFDLMKTLSRTVQGARPPSAQQQILKQDPAAGASDAVDDAILSWDRMLAKPLAVLQKAQQAAETSYCETHAQVYLLMADRIQGSAMGSAKFTTSCAGPLLSLSAGSPHEIDEETAAVISMLRPGRAPPGSQQLTGRRDSAAQTDAGSSTCPKDDGFFADWKKWLVAWELRAAEFSAAELAGEIDYLQSKDLSDDGGPRKEELPGGELWATWRRLGGTLRSRAGLPWRKAKEGSDLRQPGRKIAIITTASLPWMTGTAVNPLLRTVFLAKDSTREVTLLVPWLSKADQATIFPSITFETPEEQETYVREWAKKRTGVEANFKIRFYPGRYAPEKGSILPIGDLTKYIPDEEADVAVLEEPEHLNWYHHGSCWTRKFSHVVGVVHTNYLDYARREEGGDVKQRLLKAINCWVCQAHCHKVVKLSGAVQPLPKEHTEFVHGVSPAFLEVGMAKRVPTKGSDERFSRGFYYIGKVVWGKGYTELLDMVEFHKASTGKDLPVDVFGGGADFADVTQTSSTKGLSLMFHGPKDHLSPDIHEYKAFVNPSTSDVVATTSAEALAMGKFVICCEHPSNKFFSQFRNCLVYRTPEEFNERVRYAMEHEPAPLSEEETFKLTWEAATERFLDIASLSVQERNPGLLNRAMDSIAYMSHNTLTGLEPVRVTAGAGAGTRDNPECVTGYSPSSGCGGGLFDRRVTESKQCT